MSNSIYDPKSPPLTKISRARSKGGDTVTIWLWIPWATRPWNQAAWGSEGLFYSLVHYSISYPLRGPIIHFPLLFHCSWPKQFNARALIVLIPLFHCSAFPLFRGPRTDSARPLKYSMDTCRFLRTKISCTCPITAYTFVLHLV
jgi:hypothetical protein